MSITFGRVRIITMSENRGDAEERGDSVDAKFWPHRQSKAPNPPDKAGREGKAGAGSGDANRYRMDYKSIGTCVIINNKNFHESTGQETREGTDVDADAVERTFRGLGYKIRREDDRTVGEMEELLHTVSQEDHSGSASFVCVLLSHGGEGTFFGTDASTELETLTGMFRGDRCKTLVAKPKLFFIQACRGCCLDDGIQTDSSSDESLDRIPVEADFLYAHSTAPGYISWRNKGKGSWFMQALCEMLNEHSNQLDLLTIMTWVNRKVARDFESFTEDPGSNKKKQMPSITTTLTKDFYFR
ncbi:caspase-3-like isoform X2 [Gadus chalcogrammus]|uniref:caspase-3-like isoform X2 n=1 Tax=Gadus chalcogrammus TaxID=1042646 RepID=UPI0024C49FD0|nr:caspase-3-like isoform X2 [Gadus chalcogrammus]